MWLWEGLHIKDICVIRKDSKKTLDIVKGKLREWNVLEEHFVYDVNGLGQYFKGFLPRAVPFDNKAAPDKSVKQMYATLKSQCAYILYQHIADNEISIESSLLDRRFSGKGFKDVPLKQILMRERKCIRRREDSEDGAFLLIKKSDMKKFVGHSPDYFESLLMRFIFEANNKLGDDINIDGLWMLT